MKIKYSQGSTKKPRSKHVAILLVEGETEEEFYQRISELKLKGISKKIYNLKGNFNINTKIIDSAFRYQQRHPSNTFDIYVCIDQEKIGAPPFNIALVESELKKIKSFKQLYPVIAVLMIESIFFIDIDGIYKFLRANKNHRNKTKYSNFRKLKHQDLSALFKQFGKRYYKGVRCEHFIINLDIDLIIGKAGEIQSLIKTARSRAKK